MCYDPRDDLSKSRDVQISIPTCKVAEISTMIWDTCTLKCYKALVYCRLYGLQPHAPFWNSDEPVCIRYYLFNSTSFNPVILSVDQSNVDSGNCETHPDARIRCTKILWMKFDSNFHVFVVKNVIFAECQWKYVVKGIGYLLSFSMSSVFGENSGLDWLPPPMI